MPASQQLKDIKILETGIPFTTSQANKIKQCFRDPKCVKMLTKDKLPRTRNPDGSLRGKTKSQHKYYESIEKYLGFQLNYSILKTQTKDLVIIYPGKTQDSTVKAATFLGAGSFGKVKLAQSLDSGKILAAKISTDELNNILAEEHMVKAVEQHFGSLARASKNESKHYLISDFVEGVSLNTFLLNPQINDAEKLKAILETFKSTKELHEKFHIVHGDLSFNNVVYDPITNKATIIDFGFAGQLQPGKTEIKLPVCIKKSDYERGYYEYYAPESVERHRGAGSLAGYAADIYTLGYWLQKVNYIKNELLQKLSNKMTAPDPTNRPTIDGCIAQSQLAKLSLKSEPLMKPEPVTPERGTVKQVTMATNQTAKRHEKSVKFSNQRRQTEVERLRNLQPKLAVPEIKPEHIISVLARDLRAARRDRLREDLPTKKDLPNKVRPDKKSDKSAKKTSK